MKREDIEEIQGRGSEYKAWTGERIVEMSKNERDELCALALRATEPDMVMVPREPTDKMMEAAHKADCKPGAHGESEYLLEVWDAMIAAAQKEQP